MLKSTLPRLNRASALSGWSTITFVNAVCAPSKSPICIFAAPRPISACGKSDCRSSAFLKLSAAFCGWLALHIRIAEIVECVRFIRLERQALLVRCDRVVQLSLALINKREMKINVGLIRFQREAFLETRGGLIHLALPVQKLSQVEPRRSVVGMIGHDLPVLRDSLVVMPGIAQRERIIRPHVER